MTFKNIVLCHFKIYIAVLLLICIITFCPRPVLAQQPLWQKVLDTGVSDIVKGIAVDRESNIIVTGRSSRETTGGDCLTVKYNLNGDTIWTMWYDSTFYNGANSVAVDGLDNVIITGDIWTDSTNADIHTVKYDTAGNILWSRTYTNGEKDVGEFGYDVTVDSKNNIIVSGKAYYNWGDYITIKYDSSGNLLWLRTYNGGWEDYCKDVAVDDSDNVIVTGFSMGDMNWDWCTIKYNSDGDTLWVRSHDVGLDDKAYGVACDKDGNIIIVGEQGQSPENYPAIVKYSPTGDTLWTKLFVRSVPLDGLMNFIDVTIDEVGNIYTAGVFVLWDSGKGWIDYYITKCNPEGDTLWTLRYDYDYLDEAIGIALDKYGDIYVTGTTNRSPQVYEQNYLTIKVKNNINNIYEESSFPKKITLCPNYPNPFNPSTIVEFTLPTANLVILKVFNFLGQEIETLVDEIKRPGKYYVRWDASQYAVGVYIARLTIGDYLASQKLLFIK